MHEQIFGPPFEAISSTRDIYLHMAMILWAIGREKARDVEDIELKLVREKVSAHAV